MRPGTWITYEFCKFMTDTDEPFDREMVLQKQHVLKATVEKV